MCIRDSLYGLPITALAALTAIAVGGAPSQPWGLVWLGWLVIGAIGQIIATFLLLELMRLRNFAVGIAWSKTEIVLIAIGGWLFLGDALGLLAVAAVMLATVGVLCLSLKEVRLHDLLAADRFAEMWRGLAAGAGFAIAAVAYRAAILEVDGPTFYGAAAWNLLWAQSLQTLLVMGYLWQRDRPVIGAVFRHWRPSLFAGTMGGLASLGWFSAFALEPAAHVRTLGLAEMLLALAVSMRLFREKTGPLELGGQALVALAVMLILAAG